MDPLPGEGRAGRSSVCFVAWTPRLGKILEDELPRVYAITRRRTERRLRTHGEQTAADALPATCPYSLDQITGDWWP